MKAKKNKGGSRNSATTNMELYMAKLLDLLLTKEEKNFKTHLSLKKIIRDRVSISKLIVQKHWKNGKYCFFFPIALH